MNKIVRRYLIDLARKVSVITYQKLSDECKLNYDMKDEIDEGLMRMILFDINIYEQYHNRPLLATLALTTNPDYSGKHIIKLADDYNILGWNKLDQIEHFQIYHITQCIGFWCNDENYKKYY